MTRNELVYKLVTTSHLNMAERAELGTPYVTRDELADVISTVVNQCGYFPPNARPWEAGRPAFEGYMLERQETGCTMRRQRSHPVAPCSLADSSMKHFRSLNKAIRLYIQKEFPGKIDGIPIK